MNICRLFFLALLFFIMPAQLSAQKPENTGWLFLSHTQKLNKKWNILLDAQTRSTDKLIHVNTILLRTALNYKLNEANSIAVGYASKIDWEHEDDKIAFQREHRIYQQYLFTSDFGKSEFTARARFEQRFVREQDRYLFSQRARAFVALQIPVWANKDFSNGVYINFQNEIFANVTNQHNVNDDLFDQNRLLGSLGYRWSKKLDTEIGYLWWRQHESDGYISTNVFQLMITTEL